MRTLVIGAGAIGGYFGGRLLEAGRDVTFLVRANRAAELAASGLRIRSRSGDAFLAQPPTVTAEALAAGGISFDLILLASKAYDLEGAIDAMAPAVGPGSTILPLLNGMRQLDRLDERFGPEHVLGGFCMISVTREADGSIMHFNDVDALVFGERDVERDAALSARMQAIAEHFAGARFQSRPSSSILQGMWEKWVLIATLAGITCLMRASVGDIVAAGAAEVSLALLEECAAIAAAQGHTPRREALERHRATLTRAGSPFVASMFRDIERHAPVEAEHLIGDLLRRGEAQSVASPTLRLAYAHLKSYEARRAREAAGT